MFKNFKDTLWKRRTIPRKIWIPAIVVLIAILGGIGWYVWNAHINVAKVSTAEQLQTTTVRRGNIVLSASGTATLNPQADATFGFRGTGQVILLNVKVGDHVTAGELLASLDDASAQLALTEAKRALAELSAPAAIQTQQENVSTAKVALQTARNALAYYVSPDVLYYEDLVAQAQQALQAAQDVEKATPSEENSKKVQDAQTALENAQSGLMYAQSKYETYLSDTFTYKDKVGRQIVFVYSPPTADQVTAARAAYAVAEQNLADEQDYLTALVTGQIPANATGTKITTLEQTQQQVTAALDTLNGTHLIAPITGTITAMNFGLGDDTGSASASITISNLDQPYIVDYYLDETDWQNVKVGFAAQVTFDILADQTFTGKVVSVDPILSTQNGALYVHGLVQLDPIKGLILPAGTGGSVTIIGGQATNVPLVPVAALHEYAPGQYAAFVMVNGKLTLRMVTIGLEDLVNAEVKSGLQQGDVVSTGIAQTK